MDYKDDIYARIPHRPPFLWVDRIISLAADRIETEKDIPLDLDVFTGHYPDYPIMPGVLLCESVFQSGGLLIMEIMNREQKTMGGIPVLTRIREAKFRREVRPGDTIRVQVEVTEAIWPACFLRGRVFVAGKEVVKVDFACMVTERKER